MAPLISGDADDTGGRTTGERDETGAAESRDDGEAPPTSLGALYRRPMANPLATLAATVVVAALVYQAVLSAVNTHPVVGVLALVAGYLAYRIARVGWRAENAFLAQQLAREELESESPPTAGD